MEMTSHVRWYLKLQNLLFVVLVVALLGVIAWLGERYNVEFDWTANQRNSLTEESVALLESLQAPLEINAYVSEDEVLRTAIRNLVARYQRVRPDIVLQFINPDLAPEQARAAGVRFDGTLILHYQGRREQVSNPGESEISEAIARLTRQRETWIAFMTGHGERAADGRANFDLGLLATTLGQQGFRLQGINLAASPLPDNAHVLVVAGPQTEWLPVEKTRVEAFLAEGGNLLWLTDPQGVSLLPELSTMLGIDVKPGTVVDATTQMLGVADPTVAVVTEYPAVGPVKDFRLVTLYPRAAALAANADSGWKAVPILRTLPNSWRETGELAGNVTLDAGDEAGPITIGYSLERTDGDGRMQRAVVIGDGDFASNAFVGNQGNLDFAVNLFNWLGEQDSLLNIHVKSAPDATLALGRGVQITIALGFLLVAPLLLLAIGVLVFLRRRRR